MGEENNCVIVETPFSAPNFLLLVRNILFAQACMYDSLMRGENPFLSHLLYTQVLDDRDPQQRTRGIEAGLAWGAFAGKTAVYGNLGRSSGMNYGIKNAEAAERPIDYRLLDDTWMKDTLRNSGRVLASTFRALIVAKAKAA